MPIWTPEQYAEWKARAAGQLDRLAKSSLPKRPVQDEPLGTGEGEESHPERLHVRIVSHRRKLTDPDNLCPKYFIDCLRYADYIPNDTIQDITLEVSQVKSKQEFTIVEVL